MIDYYAEDARFHRWVKNAPPSRIQRVLSVMVRECAWRNEDWLTEYITNRPVQSDKLGNPASA